MFDALQDVVKCTPRRAPPIPLTLSDLGQIGHVSHHGVYINSALRHHVDLLLNENNKIEKVAKEVSKGRLNGSDFIRAMRAGSDSRDAIRFIKSMSSVLSSWGEISGRFQRSDRTYTFALTKDSVGGGAQSTWSSAALSAGLPRAITYGNIPGPAAIEYTTPGAVTLPMTPSPTESLYLSGINIGSGAETSSIVMLVDLLQGATNINANVTTTQSVLTTTLTRYTGGEGVMMTLEGGTTLGATQATVTVTYVNQAGAEATSSLVTVGLASPGTIATSRNPFMPLVAGDYGVRSMKSATLSIGTGAGTLVAVLFKPLILSFTLSLDFLEMSLAEKLGRMKLLAAPGAGLPFLSAYVATPVQLSPFVVFFDFVWG